MHTECQQTGDCQSKMLQHFCTSQSIALENSNSHVSENKKLQVIDGKGLLTGSHEEYNEKSRQSIKASNSLSGKSVKFKLKTRRRIQRDRQHDSEIKKCIGGMEQIEFCRVYKHMN